MTNIHYCRAHIELGWFGNSQAHFGRGDLAFQLDAKTSLRWYDQVIAIFFGCCWVPLPISDRDADFKKKDIYVRVQQLAQLLNIEQNEVTQASTDELARKFYQAKLWKTKSERLKVAVSRFGITSCNHDEVFALCKYIEDNKKRVISDLLKTGESILKVKKSPVLKWSIYFVKERNSDKVGIFIHLGKNCSIGKGAFKVVSAAVDYKRMANYTLAKIKLEKHANSRKDLLNTIVTQNEVRMLQGLPFHKRLLVSRFHGEIKKNTNSQIYIFTRYCELGNLLEKFNHFTPQQTLQIMKDSVKGLQVIHKAGKVHQDLKPENIFLHIHEITGCLRAKIADFGQAANVNNSDVEDGNIQYSAPWKLRREDHPIEADIWALGLIFYDMLYGIAIYEDIAEKAWDPFERSSDVAIAYKAKYAKDLPYAKGPLNDLIFKMMNPDYRKTISLNNALEALDKLTLQDCKVDPLIKALFSMQ